MENWAKGIGIYIHKFTEEKAKLLDFISLTIKNSILWTQGFHLAEIWHKATEK